jgi:hypothetical protein
MAADAVIARAADAIIVDADGSPYSLGSLATIAVAPRLAGPVFERSMPAECQGASGRRRIPHTPNKCSAPVELQEKSPQLRRGEREPISRSPLANEIG